MILLLALLVSINSFALEINPNLGKVVDQCSVKNSTKHVWIFKQWHLSPGVDTTKVKVVPQEENQTAIFEQLDQWIKDKGMHTIISEGCSGFIDEKFSQKFNGWNYASLEKISSTENFKNIVTLVPLKLEAKYNKKIQVPCGDDENLIKEQSLAFSDARGSVGFLIRLKQFKEKPDQAKPYLENVIKLDHLPEKTSLDEGVKHLQEDLKKSVIKIKEGFEKRNAKFVATIKSQSDTDMALVIGGIHGKALVSLLNEANIDCTVIEPKGYHSDDEKILADLDKALED
jgi:hypothetical protein